MDLHLKLSLFIGIIIFTGLIFYYLKTDRLNLKYALLWIFADVSMVFFLLFPSFPTFLSELMGIKELTNFIFLIVGLFSLLILLSLTVIISKLNNRTYTLTQNLAIVEKRLREVEEREKSSD